MAFFPLDKALILDVEGKDAVRYLSARLTNDIRSLAVGAGSIAAMLSPQGKTEGLFLVLRRGESLFRLIADAGDHEKQIAALRRFIVADRVEIANRSSELAMFHITEMPSSLPPLSFSEEGGIIHISRDRGFGPGADIIGDQSALDARYSLQSFSPIVPDEVTVARIKRGIPSFPRELNENLLFSEARLFSAVSFQKGCYVGQEVVERVEALGKTSKILQSAVLDMSVEVPAGEVVTTLPGSATEPAKAIGTVLSSAVDSSSGKTYLFLSLKNDPGLQNTSVVIAGSPGKILWQDKR